MTLEELEEALRGLDELARREYGESLSQVAARPGHNDEMRLFRLGRLIGVELKRPFAKEVPLPSPAPYSAARFKWELDDSKFQDHSAWQYKAVEALRTDPDVVEALGWQPQDVAALAASAQNERGFFKFVAVSCRKYLCRDPKLLREINRGIEAAKRAGFDLKNVTPDIIVAAGGLAVGAQLVLAIPALGVMGAPVIAGIIFAIYSVGIDAFCGWASKLKLDNDPKVLTEHDG
jgi:hypothetical protein